MPPEVLNLGLEPPAFLKADEAALGEVIRRILQGFSGYVAGNAFFDWAWWMAESADDRPPLNTVGEMMAWWERNGMRIEKDTLRLMSYIVDTKSVISYSGCSSWTEFIGEARMTPPEACKHLRKVALSDDALAELTRIKDRLTGSGMSLSNKLKRVNSDIPLLFCVLRLFGRELTEDAFNLFFLKRKQEALGQESTEMLEFVDYAEGQQVIISKMLKELGRSDATQSLLKEMPPSLATSSCLGDFILSAMNTDLILNLMKKIEIEVANMIGQQISEASSSIEDTASNLGPPSATSNSNPNRPRNAKPSRNNRHVKTSPQQCYPQVPANNSQPPGKDEKTERGGEGRELTGWRDLKIGWTGNMQHRHTIQCRGGRGKV
uniref:Uncharacterized protein n=1 Tax=Chromera velia CCMP2878 TaxID=1169474 RepID=A0A0G4HIC1_9ALVE|eukprot:Cvel_27770.t1-p1 / transcript=Cvel_27770.t1 / gene=Cvel_27770 / organism=Chromera_velia_CCMP2878 / gene_product=hypothetical protein / transcript_product=hypothetical protein / location=Cvel_scaffold3521:3333-9148(-) / protein_length=376 / sequence_SO=supercontig / SO=protein_coding / is_pseudo=false